MKTSTEAPAERLTEPPARRPPRETLNLRIPSAERGLIDRAAQSSGKTRTGVILRFLALLDAPPKPNARLRRTMQSTPPWAKH